jgi:hypothetical protein
MGGAYGLDFAAVLALADAMGALTPLLVELLPALEQKVLLAYRRDNGDAPDLADQD